MNNYNIEHNVKKTPSKHSNGSNDPPLPLTSSDEEDNINTNATVNTPSPSISRRYNYTEAMQSDIHAFESPFNPIHSLSYAIRQHSTTNTITSINTTINNTENNTQKKNVVFFVFRDRKKKPEKTR
eukprot:423187_1